MNDTTQLSEDPRLTAYALGELSPDECLAVEAALRANPALRAAVDEIRATAALLEGALAGEPQVAAGPAAEFASPHGANGAVIPSTVRQPSTAQDSADARRPARPRGKLIVFPQFYYIAGGLAVAGFAVMVALYRDTFEAREKIRAENLRVAMEQRTAEGRGMSREGTMLLPFPPVVVSDGGVSALSVATTAPNPPAYAFPRDNRFRGARQHPLSTFAIDVDTASYTDVRRFIERRQRPPAEAVRIEELLNYFSYNYPAPTASADLESEAPVAASLEVAAAPWAPAHRLVRIGIKGRTTQQLRDGAVTGPLMTIARDVKIQVEFNPATVASYRLIGYEHPSPAAADLADDPAEADEIGSGHTVTALYEIVPVGAERATGDAVAADGAIGEFRYRAGSVALGVPEAVAGELLTVRLRYKEPAGGVSKVLEFPLIDHGGQFDGASADFRFAAAVAEFGMILRGSPHRGAASLNDVLAWAATATARPTDDSSGDRAEFIDLVRKTQSLME